MVRFKKVIALFCMLTLVASLISISPVAASASSLNSYYVDAVYGNDNNSGLSPGQAWKTLNKVNSTEFVPGDQILFKAGDVWNGHLTIDDSGYGANRITFDKYGEGPKPIIAGGGVPKTIFVKNAEYVTIKNLEITNDAPDNDHRYGIFVSNDTGRTLRSLHFESLDIHNVKGNYAGSLRFWSAAIGFNAYKSNSSYDDFLIADSHIYDNESHGIQSDGDEAVKDHTFFTNVVIRNNFFERNGNGDIVVGLCDSPLIEYNTSYDQGGGFEGYGYTVSMWEWLSKNAVFQNNEVAYTNHDPLQDNDDGDSQAFDADIATVDRVTFQYNYSHDNAGGFLLVMGNSQENYKGATVRYNVSFNDHKTNVNENTTLSINHAGSEGSYIYNNVFYNNVEDEGIHIKSLATESSKIYYQNNIFYASAESTYPSASDSNNVFDYNGYFGTGNIAPVEDTHAVTGDPKFAEPIPAVPTDGMEGADVFKLSSDSPYINAGTIIADNGGRDFWGNSLYKDAPDIGAHEFGSPTAAPVTVTPKPLLIPDAVDPAIHAGRWSVKAVSTGTASNSELKQIVTGIQPNQAYEAKVWVKGTGGYTLSVSDGNTVIDDISFEALNEWTQIQLPVNSGNARALVYALTETGGTAGTAYFDDAYLGVAEGANLLDNSSFEYGNRPWARGDVFTLFHTIDPTNPDTPEPEPEPELPTTAEQVNEEFDSSALNARWKWVSEDPSKWSLSTNPGNMNIVSSGGDVDSTKNVLLQWAPKGDFTIETKVSAIPTADWEQTGLLVYIDGANHIKLNRVHDGELKFQFGYKQAGVWNSGTYTNINDTEDDNADYYLKLEKKGATYTGYYSQDGTAYTKIGSYTVYFPGNKRIGLYNCNGTNVIADFDYFRMTSLNTDAVEPTAPPTTPPPVDNAAHSGDYAIKVDHNSAASNWKSMGYNDIAVTPNTDVYFKAWVKGSGKVKVAFTADWSTYNENDLTSTDEWTEISIKYNTGDASVIHVSIKTTDSPTTMFIDDVFFGTSDGGIDGENLINNASFEDGSGPWWGVNGPFSLVEVIDANSKPDFYPLRDKSIRENNPLLFTIHATDKNGNPLTYSAANLPAGAAFNASSRIFSWTPTYSQAGVYTVTFIVTDGTSTVSEDVQISVVDGPTPPTAPSTTPSPIPSNPQPGTVKIAAIPDGNGKAVVDVKASELQAALLDAKASFVDIIVEGAESAKSVVVNLSGESIQSALDNKIKQFNINTGLAVISISTELLKKQNEAFGNVQLSVTNVDSQSLSDQVKAAVGSHPVYDFNLSVDGKQISQFGDQAVTVKLNYTLKPGEDPNQIIIYNVNDNGKLDIVKNGKFDSATGKVTFSTTHFSKYAIALNVVSFNDIANVTWAQESIEALAARGIIQGVGGGSFKPNDQLTRAAFISMLMNAFDLIDSKATTSLTDVKKDAWYYGAIASAQQLGIVKGKSDGNFGIHDQISRQDMAVMIYNAGLAVKANFIGNAEAASFRDQSEIAAYAVNAVAAIQQAGIINGVGSGKFAPRDVATRAQAAVVIWNMFTNAK